jgi:hypothetical protein
LYTLAVAFIRMTTGVRPHRKRTMPPRLTAATTFADVQLDARPVPTQRVGRDAADVAGTMTTNEATRTHEARMATARDRRCGMTRRP